MVILKSYYDAIKNPGAGAPRKILESYGDSLEAAGWKYSIAEAGYVSPDGAVLFITDRSPYQGRLLCNDYNKESQFESYKQSMIRSGVFIEK